MSPKLLTAALFFATLVPHAGATTHHKVAPPPAPVTPAPAPPPPPPSSDATTGVTVGFYFVVALVIGVVILYEYGKNRQPVPTPGVPTAPNFPGFVCTACHSRVTPKVITKSGGCLEILLWFFFIIPGILYTLWRLNQTSTVCPVCGTPNPIPIATPAGQRILAEANGGV